jgi:biopolymer transport protein ExbD
MAETENKKNKGNNKRPFIVKRNTRVDLTPMVDLGFLLITFFVFTTTMSSPTVMNINMPFDKVPPGDLVCESCVLTVILAKNSTIQYYEGMRPSHTGLKETFFGDGGIRKIILQKRKLVQKLKGTADDFILIIKPSPESTFKNFVDIVDEVAINDVKHYYTSETDDEDVNQLIAEPLKTQ